MKLGFVESVASQASLTARHYVSFFNFCLLG